MRPILKRLQALLLLVIAPWWSMAAVAQDFPQAGRTITLVVPFGPGSGTDVIARILAEDMGKRMGVPIVVDNKPGANGIVATELVSRAKPDGYVLLLGTSSAHSANQWLMKNLRYEPIDGFTPIARAIHIPFYLAVNSASPFIDLEHFLRRASTGVPLSMAYGNSTGQVAGQHLRSQAGFKATDVAYRSTPAALLDLAAGRVDFMFVDIASSQGLMKEGRIRPIAMMADQTSALLPGVPALGERYPGFTFIGWAGLLGPRGMPDAIVQKLNAEVTHTLAMPEISARLISLGLEPSASTPQEFARFMRDQERVWGRRIKAAGIEPQ